MIWEVPPPHTLWLPGVPFGDGQLSTVVTGLVLLAVAAFFNGNLVSTVRFDPPVYLLAPQWILLAATPVLALAAGARLVSRHERRLASGALLT